jgi:predicted DNA-binding antitoxin AbrB/MazE fold protein
VQACRAYYQNGRFVPLGIGKLPEGTQAIITVLDEAPRNIAERLVEFDRLMDEIRAATGEEMPEIERIKFDRASEL